METLQTKHPNETSSTVNQEKSIPISHPPKTITKDNIQVNSLKSTSRPWESRSLSPFCNGRILTQGGGGVTTVDELGILCSHTDVGIVPEPAIAKKLIDLIGSEVSSGIRSIGSVAWANSWRSFAIEREEGHQRRFGNTTNSGGRCWSVRCVQWIRI
jgi:hypothetical protein